MSYREADGGDAQGNAGGSRPRDPGWRSRLRLRTHDAAACQGGTDIAEGTIYAILVRIEQKGLVTVEKLPSEKGPPRKVHSLNAAGEANLEAFWKA